MKIVKLRIMEDAVAVTDSKEATLHCSIIYKAIWNVLNMLQRVRELYNASGGLLCYSVKKLGILHDEFHVLLANTLLLQRENYNLNNVLKAYRRVGLKFHVTANVTFNGSSKEIKMF